ncbi:MAG: PEPxxWA-CTERM sorting domain-containing protein [Pseudomonadota bacterium]
MKLKLLSALALIGALMLPTATQAQTPIANQVNVNNVAQNGNFTLGFSFTVANDMSISALGAYDDLANGFVAPKTVGLWTNAGALLSQVSVTNSNALIDNFRYAAITPVTVSAGTTYVVGAWQYSGSGDVYSTAPGGTNPPPGVTTIQGRLSDTGSFSFPNQLAGTEAYFGANALIGAVPDVPEPATWGLMIMGFGVAGSALRRRPKARFAVA